MSSVSWSEPALDDVKALSVWLGRDSESLSNQVVERIFEAVEQAIPFPRIGRVVSEVGDESVRELLFRTFRIIYQAAGNQIVVLSVLHGGRPTERREPRRWEIY